MPLTKFLVPYINSPTQIREKPMLAELNLVYVEKLDLVFNNNYEPSLIEYDSSYYTYPPPNQLQATYEIIKANLSKGSRLVEIGCGKGGLLDLIREDSFFSYAGFDTSYEGNDPRIKKRYLQNSDSDSADLIILRHVLEHIKYPHRFLKLLMSNFQANPSIYIEVPKFDWIEQNLVLYDLFYEHVNYFKEKSLKKLFSKFSDYGVLNNGQYHYIIAKLDNLKFELWEETLNCDPNKFNKYPVKLYFDQMLNLVEWCKTKNKIWLWGVANKGTLFLLHLKNLAPEVFSKIAGVVDSDPGIQQKFTRSTNLRIENPAVLFENIRENDVVLISNPAYYTEIKNLCSEISLPKIFFRSIN